jgi:mannose-6-phosphate isomerase-like protein (cupin superfamily)
MPVIKSQYDALPDWSELTFYEVNRIKEDRFYTFIKRAEKNELFVLEGECLIKSASFLKKVKEFEMFEIPDGMNSFELYPTTGYCGFIIAGGKWNDDHGSIGTFKIANNQFPKNDGDPADYDGERRTDFDNHFHDCDEFWIIYEGKGKIATEGNINIVEAGNCVATKAGDHHDMIDVYEPIRGAYLETSLMGRKRSGHLWERTLAAKGKINIIQKQS